MCRWRGGRFEGGFRRLGGVGRSKDGGFGEEELGWVRGGRVGFEV